MSACLIVGSLFSLLSKNILVASLDDLGIDLYIGILGQGESIRLAWDDIQSVSIANRDIKTKTTSTSLFITVTNEVTHKVLAIKIATPLSQNRQEELQCFNKRLVTRGLIFDDESSEFWIKDSVKGGLSKLMNSINKNIA